MHLHAEVQIVRILPGWRLVVQSIVRVVEPPLAVLVDKFLLAFEEVSMVLVLPADAASIVGKRSIAGVPVGDDSAVAAKRPEVHDRNGTDGVKSGGIDGLVQTGVNAGFRPGIRQPALGVGAVRTGQRTFGPVGAIEHCLIRELGVWPAGWHLFVVGQKQLPTINR